jgi:aryl-alcohol dehydrogenase-like predicted oxidoreductase
MGCNNLGRPGTACEGPEGAERLVGAAIDAGVTLFDTADVYGGRYGLSEELLGEALGGRRDQVVIATKFGHAAMTSTIPSWQDRGSRRYLRRAVEGSLRRLRTDWIDLYQLHTPDPNTPIEETLAALDELVQEGKIRYVGSSNFRAWQLVEAEFTARAGGWERFISAQNEYSLLARGAERELLPVARRYGVGFLPYFPLYNGIFTGKYTRAGGPEGSRIMKRRRELLETVPWDVVDKFEAFAKERGITMLQATMGWLLSVEGLSSVIAGATVPEQIGQNAEAGDAWRPTAAEAEEISALFA